MGVFFVDEAQHRAAHVVHYTRLTSTTRRSLTNSSSNSNILLCNFGSFDKKLSGSTICFQGYIGAWGNNACATTLNLHLVGSYNNSNYIVSGGTATGYPIAHYNYTADSYYKICVISGAITGHTGTGSQSVLVAHRTANGNSDRPFNIINPNASDDTRIENSMGGSSLSVWEMNL